VRSVDAAGALLLLLVELNTLVSGKGVTVAGGTLGSSAAFTFGAVALGQRVRLMMAHRLLIAVLRLVSLMVQRTLHALRAV
jgi:hypothetical protein